MKYRRYVPGALLVTLLMAWSPTWACGGLGPNKHFGELLEIDWDNTFTIQDAETSEVLTFRGDDAIMESLTELEGYGYVVVDFKTEGTELIAVSVEKFRL